jgi:hypothetical protein
MDEEHKPIDNKEMKDNVEQSFINNEMEDSISEADKIERQQYTGNFATISETAKAFNSFGHFDESMIQGVIYMTISRLLGPRVDINRDQLSWLFGSNSKIAPNLFMLLIGPPGYFSRSSIIRNQRDWCKSIKTRYLEKFGSELIANGEATTTIIGSSMEGVSDDLAGFDEVPDIPEQSDFELSELDEEEKTKKKKTKRDHIHKYVHIDAGECGQALKKLVNPNSYQYGLLDVLNDVFYGDEVKRTLRKTKVEIPGGQYVTFLGTIHLDELVNELLETGFLRRTVTIIKTEADYAFTEMSLEQKKAWDSYYKVIEEDFIKHMINRAEQILNVSVKLTPKAEEYLNNLDNKIKSQRVETKDSNEYPSNNLELIVRLSILHAIYEGTLEQNTIFVSNFEIGEALEFLTGLDKRYRSYTSRLISADILRRVDLTQSIVENYHKQQKNKGVSGFQMFASVSTLYHRLPYMDSAKMKDLEVRAIEMGRIKGVELYREGRKPKTILYPRYVDDKELIGMKLEGDRLIFK